MEFSLIPRKRDSSSMLYVVWRLQYPLKRHAWQAFVGLCSESPESPCFVVPDWVQPRGRSGGGEVPGPCGAGVIRSGSPGIDQTLGIPSARWHTKCTTIDCGQQSRLQAR